MPFIHYKQLDVYKLAFRLAVEIHKMVETFPKHEQFGLGDQMRRASRSICANIAEGLGKGGTDKDETRYLQIAMGSTHEMSVWIDMCEEFGYVKADQVKDWQERYEKVGRMLYGLMERRKKG